MKNFAFIGLIAGAGFPGLKSEAIRWSIVTNSLSQSWRSKLPPTAVKFSGSYIKKCQDVVFVHEDSSLDERLSSENFCKRIV